jgi:surface antigen
MASLAGCAGLPDLPISFSLLNPPGLGLNQIDQERASDAAETALESGIDEGWSNPASGNRGEFHPGPAYRRPSGDTCRDFTHAIYTGGSRIPYEITGTACRVPGQAPGWRVVS